MIVLIAAVAAIGIAVYFLRPEPPPIPRDKDHPEAMQPKACLSCHGPGEEHARKPTHPNVNDCFRCHAWRAL